MLDLLCEPLKLINGLVADDHISVFLIVPIDKPKICTELARRSLLFLPAHVSHHAEGEELSVFVLIDKLGHRHAIDHQLTRAHEVQALVRQGSRQRQGTI